MKLLLGTWKTMNERALPYAVGVLDKDESDRLWFPHGSDKRPPDGIWHHALCLAIEKFARSEIHFAKELEADGTRDALLTCVVPHERVHVSDNDGASWYACYEAWCMEPPLYMVKAASEHKAIEIAFLGEDALVCDINDPDSSEAVMHVPMYVREFDVRINVRPNDDVELGVRW